MSADVPFPSTRTDAYMPPRVETQTVALGYPNDWGDPCPVCGETFPVLHGPHPTWVACREGTEGAGGPENSPNG